MKQSLGCFFFVLVFLIAVFHIKLSAVGLCDIGQSRINCYSQRRNDLVYSGGWCSWNVRDSVAAYAIAFETKSYGQEIMGLFFLSF